MSKRAGKFTKIWVEGYALTTLLTTANPSTVADEIEVGGFTQDKYYLSGRVDSTIAIEGFFSDTTGETHDALKSIASGSTASVVTIATGNNAAPVVGDPTMHLQAQQLEYTGTPDLNGAVAISANFKAGIDQVTEYGILLADQTVTADGDGASVDNSASSSAGGVGYFHITGLSASDSVLLEVQDSTDDAAWSTLVASTINGASAVDGERVTVAGTVNRYVQGEWDVTGSDISFPIVIGFVRN